MLQMKLSTYILVLALCSLVFLAPVLAFTTQITVTRMSADGITPTDAVATRTYQEMEAGLPVMGDGNTWYYYQGPVFEGEWEANYGVSYPEYRTDWGGTPPAWEASEERWDRFWNGERYVQNEEVNWQTKNLGKLKGTNVKDLVDLVGGAPEGRTVRIIAEDNVYQDLPAAAINNPVPRLGPYVITWWSEGAGEGGDTRGYTGPDYSNGMRATFFSDNSGNPSGEHVAGLGDQAAALPADYWYYYSGSYPSMGGWTLKYVDRINVYSDDPVPPPVAAFSANTKTGRIVNGNFESGLLPPWTGSAATVSAYTQRKGSYSLRLQAPANGDAWARQSLDLTDVATLRFWRHQYGGTAKYLQVLVDDTVVANYTETVTVPNRYETIDLSGYSFTGTHDLTFRSVSGTGTLLTVYLDDIEDYGPGTAGDSPLTVQFQDLSTKMEDTTHSSWAWDFDSNGVTDSTERNPQYTFTTPGTYSVTLTATNAGGSDSETRTSYIVVNADNVAPVAQAQSVSTNENTPLAVTLTATDADGDSLTYTVVDNPLHGSLSGSAPSLTYTPAAGYAGPDSFTFRANDGTVNSNTATISITVNAVNVAPVAQAQSVSTNENTALPITLTATDADGDPLTYAVVDNPLHGSLSGSAPALTYTPAAGYAGPDSFTFRANDGTVNSNTATISITVNAVNVAPVAQAQSVSTNENTPLPITLTATDADGDSLTYSVVGNPSHGSLTGSAPDLTYTPAAGYSGPDSFTFRANDGTVNSNTAVISITVNAVNVAPVAQAQSVSTNENTPLPITLTATDADGDPLTYAVVDNPLHGSLSGSAPALTYTPTAGYAGPDSFTFRANDGTVNSNTATISITVNAVNVPPVAQAQSVSTNENTPLPITLAATDADGDLLTYAVVDNPVHGSLSGSAPVLTYTPAAGYTGPDSFTFRANDGTVNSNTATISITVNAVNVAPVAGFTASPRTGTAPLAVTFTDTSAKAPTAWRWAYRNATVDWTEFATIQNPIMTFPAGTYDISLTATNGVGNDEEIQEGYITVSAFPPSLRKPMARFAMDDHAGLAPLTVTFTDQSKYSPGSYHWDFGDGSTSGDENPAHTFNAAGAYRITLTVTNSAGTDSATRIVHVRAK